MQRTGAPVPARERRDRPLAGLDRVEAEAAGLGDAAGRGEEADCRGAGCAGRGSLPRRNASMPPRTSVAIRSQLFASARIVASGSTSAVGRRAAVISPPEITASHSPTSSTPSRTRAGSVRTSITSGSKRSARTLKAAGAARLPDPSGLVVGLAATEPNYPSGRPAITQIRRSGDAGMAEASANMRSCAGRICRSKSRTRRSRPRTSRASATPPSSAASTRRRPSASASTRSTPAPRSTRCRSNRGCPSATRSTRTGDARMRAPTAHRWRPRSSRPTGALDPRRRSVPATRSTARSWTADTAGMTSPQVVITGGDVETGVPDYARDGTELVASVDHRFLTRRGWKHVIGAEQGPDQRPHLTLQQQADRYGRVLVVTPDFSPDSGVDTYPT